MNPIWDDKGNEIQMVLVTWPRWPPCSKRLETVKDLLQNYWVNCLETWYVASGTVVLQNLYKTSSWVDLYLIYGKGQFWFHRHFNEKSWNNSFSDSLCTLEYGNELNCIRLMNARGQGHFKDCLPLNQWHGHLHKYCFIHHCYLFGPSVRWAFTGPMVLWLFLKEWSQNFSNLNDLGQGH